VISSGMGLVWAWFAFSVMVLLVRKLMKALKF